MRLPCNRQFLQSGGVTSLIAECCGRVVVGVAALPVRQDDRLWLRLPDFLGQRIPVFDGCGEARITEIQVLAAARADREPRCLGFLSSNLRCTSSTHFPLREVED